jgi:uncharacterized protein (DUF4415 family)
MDARQWRRRGRLEVENQIGAEVALSILQEAKKRLQENWLHAQRRARAGAMWKAREEPISLRVDKDVLDWPRRQGPGYQTTINRILRERMEAER